MTLQDHIHIATTLNGTPEFSPIHKWKVPFPEFNEEPEIIYSKKRTSKGKLRWHTVQDANGPIQFENVSTMLTIKSDDTYTARQYVNFLKLMNGKSVYYVGFEHADDGADHTNDIKTMRLRIGRIRPMVVDFSWCMVEVELTDDFTVV